MSGSDDLSDRRSFCTPIIASKSGSTKDALALSDVSSRDAPWDTHRRESDQIERFYQNTQFQPYADRIHFCSELLDFKLNHSDEGELKLKLAGARFCRVRTCMVCIWRKSLRWKAKVYKALPNFLVDHPGHRFLFVTLTVKNCEIGDLRDTLNWMNESFTRLSRLRLFPGEGWIKTVEVTMGRKGDAHPHFHLLLAVKSAYFGRNYLSQQKWVEMWQKSLRVDYKPVLDVQALKAKDSLIALIAEVVKYQTKPSNLLCDRDWFLEYTSQMSNTKSISVGGVFRDYFKDLEQDPEDLIGEDDTEVGEEQGHLYFGWKRREKRYRMVDP
jgi:plasmid rolling circle replication initiator protein Rep